MFKKLVLMLSLVACTGLNAVAKDGESSEGSFSKARRVLWTDRNALVKILIVAIPTFLTERLFVSKNWLKSSDALNWAGNFVAQDSKCGYYKGAQWFKNGKIQATLEALAGSHGFFKV